eukprot:scaffold106_cov380-Prasinococcus_capsulatus_cf.AAC.23
MLTCCRTTDVSAAVHPTVLVSTFVAGLYTSTANIAQRMTNSGNKVCARRPAQGNQRRANVHSNCTSQLTRHYLEAYLHIRPPWRGREEDEEGEAGKLGGIRHVRAFVLTHLTCIGTVNSISSCRPCALVLKQVFNASPAPELSQSMRVSTST